MGDILIDGFKKLEKKHKIIGEVRGKGLMLGLEIVKDKESREVAPQHVQRVMELCRDRGLLIGRGAMAANVIRIKPPFCIDKSDCDFIIKTLDECFTIVEKQ
jgi:4-aminobutyrate aminotransferase-like enzyme